MGFFKNLFSKNKNNNGDECEWDKVQSSKDDLDMDNPAVREQYVLSCLEQMQDASRELDAANAEYDLVTSYLTDMEEIDDLEGNVKFQIDEIAKHLHDLRKDHDDYVLSPSLISEEAYKRMETMYKEAEAGIDKLEKEEDMREKIKADLKRLDREKSAYSFRKRELGRSIANLRGTARIVMIAGAVTIVILFLIQAAGFVVPQAIYYIVIVALALGVTVIYLKYADSVSEKRKADNTFNELILLENKVKIRYVNNKNLLDYLYTKYNVASAAELRKLLEDYLVEKEARRKYERNEAVYEDEMNRLMRILKTLDIRYPEIWTHQTDALYDSREMVEIRHSLIGRRQKLRKQMEYNEQIALEAGEEVKSVVRDYPQYSESIIALVDAFEKKS